jgi:3-oxoacyl-[acyl-carrier-protein] synthase III
MTSSDYRPARTDNHADKNAVSAPEQIDADNADDLPTSFGVFKPVGHVMLGLPTQAQVDALVTALHDAGWPPSSVRQFAPKESAAELREMVDNAGVLAGFGYEITLLRRYADLAEAGYRWLLVKADDTERATEAADLARAQGATLAVYYRTLTVEELIS